MSGWRHISQIPDVKAYPTLKCGLKDFDRGNHFRKGAPDLNIIGARPSVGKTLLMAQIAMAMAAECQVLFYSLEMTGEQIRWRLRKNPYFDQAASDFHVWDGNTMHVSELAEMTAQIHETNPVGFVAIDYTQIVHGDGRNKAEEVGHVVRTLKELAKHIGAPVTALAQLNRNIESRELVSEFVEPVMSDLADSSEIEKWADRIFIMHRLPKVKGQVKITVVKNRHGEKHHFVLSLNSNTMTFEDAEVF